MLNTFLYRRLSRWVTCQFKISREKKLSMASKHHVSSFQDVMINPFYWQCLNELPTYPKRIIDLGANYGYFSILCQIVAEYRRESVTKFTLVEANASILSALKKNLAEFGIRENSFKLFHGLAGPTKKERFATNSKNHLMSSVDRVKGSFVDFIDFNDKEFSDPDLIKIDIEGSEFELVKNYKPWLRQAKYIIVELHGSAKENSGVLDDLESVGFISMISHHDRQTGYSNHCLIQKDLQPGSNILKESDG